MTRLIRIALLSAVFGLPLMAVAPAGQAATPVPFEEVAQAQNPTQAAPRQRTRRQQANRQRSSRQHAQRQQGSRQHAQPSRRARASQG